MKRFFYVITNGSNMAFADFFAAKNAIHVFMAETSPTTEYEIKQVDTFDLAMILAPESEMTAWRSFGAGYVVYFDARQAEDEQP